MDTTDPNFDWSVDVWNSSKRLITRLLPLFRSQAVAQAFANQVSQHDSVVTGIPIFESTLSEPHDRAPWMTPEYNVYHLWTYQELSTDFQAMIVQYFGAPAYLDQNHISTPEQLAIKMESQLSVTTILFSNDYVKLYWHRLAAVGAFLNNVARIFDQLPFEQLATKWNGSAITRLWSRPNIISLGSSRYNSSLTFPAIEWIETTLTAIDLFLRRGCTWPDVFKPNEIELLGTLREMIQNAIANGSLSLQSLPAIYEQALTIFTRWLRAHDWYWYRVGRSDGGLPDHFERMIIFNSARPDEFTLIDRPFTYNDLASEEQLRVRLISRAGTVLGNEVLFEQEDNQEEDDDDIEQAEHNIDDDDDFLFRYGDPYDLNSENDEDMQDLDVTFDVLPHQTCRDLGTKVESQRQIMDWLESTEHFVVLDVPEQDARWGKDAFCFRRRVVRQLLDNTHNSSLFERCGDEPRDPRINLTVVRLIRGTGNPSLPDVFVLTDDVEWAVKRRDIRFFQLRSTDVIWQSRQLINGSECVREPMRVYRLRGIRERIQ
jgi:hypothetical protein